MASNRTIPALADNITTFFAAGGTSNDAQPAAIRIAVLTGHFPPKLTQTYSLVEMEAFEQMGFDVSIFPMTPARVSQLRGIETLPIDHLYSQCHDLPEAFESDASRLGIIPAIQSRNINQLNDIITSDKYLLPHIAAIMSAVAYVWQFPQRLTNALQTLNTACTDTVSPIMSGKHELLFLQSILIGHQMALAGINIAYAQNAAMVGLSAILSSIIAGDNAISVVQGHNNDTTILSHPERLLRLGAADIITVDSMGSQRPFLEAIAHAQSTAQISTERANTLRNKIHVIPRGIKLNLFTRTHDSSYIHTRNGTQPSQTLKLITVARPIEKKGIRYLIDALKILKRESQLHVKLIYIGDDPKDKNKLADLQQYAKAQHVFDHIEFLGYQPHTEIKQQLMSADIHVAPYIRLEEGGADDVDGLARIFLEAAAMKVPSIGTDTGATTDFLNNENGVLIPQRDPQALAKAIIQLACPNKRNNLANQAYTDVRRSYHYATAQLALIPLMQNAIRNKQLASEHPIKQTATITTTP